MAEKARARQVGGLSFWRNHGRLRAAKGQNRTADTTIFSCHDGCLSASTHVHQARNYAINPTSSSLLVYERLLLKVYREVYGGTETRQIISPP